MKLSEFKKMINAFPPELDSCSIILQKDSEGNGYSPLSGIDANAAYVPDNTWSGNVYGYENSASDNCMEENEWEELKKDKSKRCIILFPIN